MIAGLKETKPAKGTEEIFYPGEIEARNDRRHRAEGLSLPQDTLRDLMQLAQEMGLPFHP